MSKIKLFILLVLILASCNSTDNSTEQGIDLSILEETESADAALVSAPFSRGVNFSGWFEVTNAQRIPFHQYNEEDFINAKSMGVDVIRLPVRLNDMTSGAPDYLLDPILLGFLDIAVGWAEKHGLFLIIDNHCFHPQNALDPDVDKVLIPVWSQIAQRYKNRSALIVYEILNEPHGLPDELWGDIQGRAIQAIRQHDNEKWIIAGGTDYNSYRKLSALPYYDDEKLIYTFHYYDPFLFTHQGASWSPPLEHFANVPFPYDRDRMPAVPAAVRGTWAANLIRDYPRDALPQNMLRVLNDVVAFSRERNVPVFCGEYGVFIPVSPPKDRVIWYKFITDALDRRNISRTSWDYYGGFGIFNSEMKGDFYTDLNTELVSAMGFTPPEQRPRDDTPLQTGFDIYMDFPGRNITSMFWGSEETIFSFYDTNSAEGQYAIRWENASRYSAFWFAFPHNRNFSRLYSEGYCIEFKARTLTPVRFDVRFINPENEFSAPWRMSYTINENNLPPDGRWHTIKIPLNQMHEHGAWVNSRQEWLNPRGEFSWVNIERFEFAAEHMELIGHCIWIDSVKITRQ